MFKCLKQRLTEDQIDISHFGNKNIFKKKSLSEILVKGSLYSRTDLKRRIIEEGLIKYVCSGCGNKGEWQGQRLSLQIEHKNGDPIDNRIENLEFLCPNCHSQTSTYCGKSEPKHRCCICKKKLTSKRKTGMCSKCFQLRREDKKKAKRFCACGSEISAKSKTGCCSSCANEKNRKTKRPRRETLEREIESMSWVGIGKKYGVSDNAVRKWAKRYDLIM